MKYTLLTLTALLFIACSPSSPKVPTPSEQNLSLETNSSKILKEKALEYKMKKAKALKLKKQKALKLKKQKAKRFLPPPPKKNIKLKKVKDDNFDAKYMYPEDTKKVKVIVKKDLTEKTIAKTTSSMTKKECIGMISQAKFDKYSAMFGNEKASLKRCAMLKAMRK